MIGQALDCIADDINAHLRRAPSDALELVVVSSIVGQDGNPPPESEDKVVLTLVSLDEEKNVIDGGGAVRGAAGIARMTEPVYLNLHVMFAATHRHYLSALDALSRVMGYIKSKPSYDRHNTPDLPGDLTRLYFNLERLAYADLSNIWSFLGANYLPAANYTIRMVGLGPRQIRAVDPAVEHVSAGN